MLCALSLIPVTFNNSVLTTGSGNNHTSCTDDTDSILMLATWLIWAFSVLYNSVLLLAIAAHPTGIYTVGAWTDVVSYVD